MFNIEEVLKALTPQAPPLVLVGIVLNSANKTLKTILTWDIERRKLNKKTKKNTK